MTLGEYLSRKGITALQFARASGITRSTVYRVLSARPNGPGVHHRTLLALIRSTGGQVGLEDLPVPRARKRRSGGSR